MSTKNVIYAIEGQPGSGTNNEISSTNQSIHKQLASVLEDCKFFEKSRVDKTMENVIHAIEGAGEKHKH